MIAFTHVNTRNKPHIFKHKGQWVFLYNPVMIWGIGNTASMERQAQQFCREINYKKG